MKPSEIKSVKGKKAWFLLPGCRALTWKGIVYCKTKTDVESLNAREEIDSQLKSHETIHVKQAESTHDSWFRFYTRYIWDWICNLPLVFVNINAPYKFIATELEAYLNENNWDYCMHGAVYQWKEFEKLTLKRKYNLAKEYYANRRNISFSNFLRKNLKNED
jgi:hypothetical protein